MSYCIAYGDPEEFLDEESAAQLRKDLAAILGPSVREPAAGHSWNQMSLAATGIQELRGALARIGASTPMLDRVDLWQSVFVPRAYDPAACELDGSEWWVASAHDLRAELAPLRSVYVLPEANAEALDRLEELCCTPDDDVEDVDSLWCEQVLLALWTAAGCSLEQGGFVWCLK